jgi:hypothetical protein
MCTEKKKVETVSSGCQCKCSDLSAANAPAAEILKQKQECHGTEAGTGDSKGE